MQQLLQNPVVVGVGAGGLGLFLGAMLSTATINSKIENGVKRSMAVYSAEIEAEGTSATDAIAALNDKLLVIEKAVGTYGEKINGLEQVLLAAGSGVMSRLGHLESNLSDAIQAAAGGDAD